MNWNVWRLWELALHEYLTNIYLSWEFALPSTTLLSISVHFKWFRLNDLLSQLINSDNIFILDKLPGLQNFFLFLRSCCRYWEILIPFSLVVLPRDLISRFYICAQFSRTTKSSLRSPKILKLSKWSWGGANHRDFYNA